MPRPRIEQAVETIKAELKGWEPLLESQGRLLEAQRIHQRTMFDMEMIKEIGYCHGIEITAVISRGACRASRRPPCWITCHRTR
jgi:excinuclease UvrABC helicase subunit UvrB